MPDAASWLAVLHQHLNRRVVKAAEKGGGRPVSTCQASNRAADSVMATNDNNRPWRAADEQDQKIDASVHLVLAGFRINRCLK